TVFTSQSGADDSYIGANFNSTTGNSTISTWLITPEVNVKDGDVLSFYTRTTDFLGTVYNDRLEVRMSTGTMTVPSGGPTAVGSFTTVMGIINDGYNDSYPHTWTQYEYTVSGVGATPVAANFAFRYNVVNGGPSGLNSDYIGIDTVLISEEGGEEPSDYCIPEGIVSTRFINNFSTTGGTENISNMASGFSTGGYGDFYDTHTLSQDAEGTVNFTADISGGTAGFRIWVDWNQDGEFDTTEEVAYSSTSYLSTQSGSFTVPADATAGETRMRVVSHWLSTTGNVDPCETEFEYGEFEDYKFIVNGGGSGDPFPAPYCEVSTFNYL